MKAQDFRIGNIVEGGTIHSIRQEFNDEPYSIELNDEGMFKEREAAEINPMPLTEEWLLKFGCTQSETFSAFWYYKDISFFHDVEHSRIIISIGGRMRYINFVHVFQNVMALAGEELSINQPA